MDKDLSSNVAAMLKKLVPYRAPAEAYLAAWKKGELTALQQQELVHRLAGAIRQVKNEQVRTALHAQYDHLQELFTQEQKIQAQDLEDADAVLDTFLHEGSGTG